MKGCLTLLVRGIDEWDPTTGSAEHATFNQVQDPVNQVTPRRKVLLFPSLDYRGCVDRVGDGVKDGVAIPRVETVSRRDSDESRPV